MNKNRRILTILALLVTLIAIPLTVFLAQKAQDIRKRALAPTVRCYTADPAFPDGYDYVPGALDVWVAIIEDSGDVGVIPGVHIIATARHNGSNERGGPFQPRTEID